jgi:hypothetical protein
MNGDSADWNTAARLRLDQKSTLEVKLVEGPPSGTHRDFKASTGRTRERQRNSYGGVEFTTVLYSGDGDSV